MLKVRGLRASLVMFFAAMFALGLVALKDEINVNADAECMAKVAGGDHSNSLALNLAGRSEHPQTAREALYLSNANAQLAAAATPGVSKAGQLETALRLANVAVSDRPKWANAWVTKSYVEALAKPGDSRAGVAAFIRSYEDGPFLRDSGGWRVAYGAAHWRLLPAATQSQIVNESAWLSVVSQSDNERLSVLLVESPAEVPFLLERAKLLKVIGRPDG